jgi:hypothetical protein
MGWRWPGGWNVLSGSTSQWVSLFPLRRCIGARTTVLYLPLCSGISKSEPARHRKISKGVVDRLFDLKHHTRLDQIAAALQVVGKRLTAGVQDLAAQSVLLTCIADRLKPVASYTRKFDAVYHSTCP